MNILLQILELGISEIVPIEELVARLKNVFTLNPDAKVNVQNLESEALQADDDTVTMIAKWQADHGLPVTVQSAPAPAPGPAPTPITDTGTAAPQTTGVGQTGDHGTVGDLGTNKPTTAN